MFKNSNPRLHVPDFSPMVLDWFNDWRVLTRIDRVSSLVSDRFSMEIGKFPEDLFHREAGSCDFDTRAIWVNPFALFSAYEVPPTIQKAMLIGTASIDEIVKQTDKKWHFVLKEYHSPRNLYHAGSGPSRSTEGVLNNQTFVRSSVRKFLQVTPATEWVVAQHIANHERLHERLTNPASLVDLSPAVSFLWNPLEDERIERIGGVEWSSVENYANRCASVFYDAQFRKYVDLDVRPFTVENSFTFIHNVILFLRFGYRAGIFSSREILKDYCLPEQWDLFEECWPPIKEAWRASTTQLVVENAEKIVELLKDETCSQLSFDCSDVTSSTTVGDQGAPMPVDEDLEEEENDFPTPSDGSSSPDDEHDEEINDTADRAKGFSHPKNIYERWYSPADYRTLVDREVVSKAIKSLREAFTIPGVVGESREESPSANRGRLTARQYRRDPEKPFRYKFVEDEKFGEVQFDLCVDWSGSMDGEPIAFARAVAVMLAEVFKNHPRVHYRVVLMPKSIVAFDSDSNEPFEKRMERIAGLLAKAGTNYSLTIRSCLENSKKVGRKLYLFAIVDGEIWKEATKLRELCAKIRETGLGISCAGLPGSSVETLERTFGEDYTFIVENLPELIPVLVKVSGSLGGRLFRSAWS